MKITNDEIKKKFTNKAEIYIFFFIALISSNNYIYLFICMVFVLVKTLI